MSWRSYKNSKYNRSDAKEEMFYWMSLFDEQSMCYGYWWDDDDDWYNYDWPGYVGNMDEYYIMKVLTLLRKLNIRTAQKEANGRGW